MKQYVVDVFSQRPFQGRSVAVCIYDESVDHTLMENIARENGSTETAFIRPLSESGDPENCTRWKIRWYSPSGEMKLNGGAAFAAAYVIRRYYFPEDGEITLRHSGGEVLVSADGDDPEILSTSLPGVPLREFDITQQLSGALGVRPQHCFMGGDLFCVMKSREELESLSVDSATVEMLPGDLLHCTAPSDEEGTDFFLRTFSPVKYEEEVGACPAALTRLAPYWSGVLGKEELRVSQLSSRTGKMTAVVSEGSVKVSGRASLFAVCDILTDRLV